MKQYNLANDFFCRCHLQRGLQAMRSSYSLTFHSSPGALTIWSFDLIVDSDGLITRSSASGPALDDSGVRLSWILAARPGLFEPFSSGPDWSPLGLHLSSG
ncbi:hypothetical protein TNCV_4009701 [Trichonephila clavipes]|nr:hypothetical protein TNCV_4009701 [Trichonephila clavipes]